MKKFRNVAIAVGALALIGVGVYALLLDEHARDELKRAAKSVGRSYQQINGLVNTFGGVVDESIELDELPNRLATLAQWEALGY